MVSQFPPPDPQLNYGNASADFHVGSINVNDDQNEQQDKLAIEDGVVEIEETQPDAGQTFLLTEDVHEEASKVAEDENVSLPIKLLQPETVKAESVAEDATPFVKQI